MLDRAPPKKGAPKKAPRANPTQPVGAIHPYLGLGVPFWSPLDLEGSQSCGLPHSQKELPNSAHVTRCEARAKPLQHLGMVDPVSLNKFPHSGSLTQRTPSKPKKRLSL